MHYLAVWKLDDFFKRVALCGVRLRHNDSYSEEWKDVTCKNCLKAKGRRW